MAGNSAAHSLANQVGDLVRENEALTRENARLKDALGRIAQLAGRADEGLSRGPRLRRRSVSSRAGRVKKRGGGTPITNPETLERRRAALAKARQVLKERRSAAAVESSTPQS